MKKQHPKPYDAVLDGLEGAPGITARLSNYFSWYEYESVMVNQQGEIIQRTAGRAKYYREDLGDGAYLDMVYIARGSFLTGASKGEHDSLDRERPQHQVTVPEFWMGKYAVTQAQWQAVMDNNPSYFPGANRPVECVSWDDCQAFCHKLSERTGKRYRLPSEAEWEYACRAGTTTPFNCGETLTTDLANYDGDRPYATEGGGQYRQETLDVGSFPPNAWGLYEMHGNVWEWCEDDWHNNYQQAPLDGSNWNRRNNQSMTKILRGGSWGRSPKLCRSAYRTHDYRALNAFYCGFQLVLDKED